jgi:pimeloyl-ACP methyl ester carboxylesterase
MVLKAASCWTSSSSASIRIIRQAVEQITVPITYFYADPGSLFSPKLADWYREHVPTQYNAVCFPNSTHMLVSDYPEKFAKEVGRVLYK